MMHYGGQRRTVIVRTGDFLDPSAHAVLVCQRPVRMHVPHVDLCDHFVDAFGSMSSEALCTRLAASTSGSSGMGAQR